MKFLEKIYGEPVFKWWLDFIAYQYFLFLLVKDSLSPAYKGIEFFTVLIHNGHTHTTVTHTLKHHTSLSWTALFNSIAVVPEQDIKLRPQGSSSQWLWWHTPHSGLNQCIHSQEVFQLLCNLKLTTTILVGTIFPLLQIWKLRLRKITFQNYIARKQGAEADLQARNFWCKSFIIPHHTISLIQTEKVEGKKRRD